MTEKEKNEIDEITDEELDNELLEDEETGAEETPTAPEIEPETAPAAAPAPKGKHTGKELTIKTPSGAEYKGLCVSERDTNSGAQVFLQLNGCVSRWFNVSDIA